MKKLNLIFFIGLLIGGIVLSGCKKDEDDEPIIGYPSIDFKGGEGYTFEDVTITTNDQILVGIMAAMHTGTQEPLTQFTLTVVSGTSTTTLVDSTFNAESFNADYNISFGQTGDATLTAKVTDNAGRSDEVSITISVEQGGVAVKKNDDLLMGNVNDLAAGSFYSTSEETVYFVSNVQENTDKVDFIFFKGPQNQNAIASPDDDDVKLVYPSINDWAVHNETRFQLTDMTVEDFDAIEEYHIFPEFTGTLTRVSHLEVDDVIFFQTAAGKHGYIKVVDLYTRGDVAQLEVIVEE